MNNIFFASPTRDNTFMVILIQVAQSIKLWMRLVDFHVSYIWIIASLPSFPAPSLSSSQVRKLLLKDKYKNIFFSGRNSVRYL